MECKYKTLTKRLVEEKGINRYIMECKYAQMKLRAYQENQELIDTLWNVNERNTDNAKYYSEQN